MATTQFIKTTDCNGTSNLSHLLSQRDQLILSRLKPAQIETVFGPGEEVGLPEKGYTDPEWYFRSSDGCVWGIGWRWGQTRLRGRGSKLRDSGFWFDSPTPDSAAEFVAFLTREVFNA